MERLEERIRRVLVNYLREQRVREVERTVDQLVAMMELRPSLHDDVVDHPRIVFPLDDALRREQEAHEATKRQLVDAQSVEAALRADIEAVCAALGEPAGDGARHVGTVAERVRELRQRVEASSAPDGTDLQARLDAAAKRVASVFPGLVLEIEAQRPSVGPDRVAFVVTLRDREQYYDWVTELRPIERALSAWMDRVEPTRLFNVSYILESEVLEKRAAASAVYGTSPAQARAKPATRHFQRTPGYDCRVQCQHQEKGDHGTHCDEWWYAVVLGPGDFALSLRVFAGNFPGRTRKPQGTDLTGHAGFFLEDDEDAFRLGQPLGSCPYLGRCSISHTTGLGAREFYEQHGIQKFNGTGEQPESFWVALEDRARLLAAEAHKRRLDPKLHRCPRCDGRGVVR